MGDEKADGDTPLSISQKRHGMALLFEDPITFELMVCHCETAPSFSCKLGITNLKIIMRFSLLLHSLGQCHHYEVRFSF